MHFSILPAEPVCKILDGRLLEDIWSLTLTCNRFRTISLILREVWVNAEDSDDIPLPLGIDSRTIDVTLLPRLAYRAILLQRKWKEPIISPVQSQRPQLSDIPSWKRWIPDGSRLGFTTPTWMYLLPGGQSFLIGISWRVGMYDLSGTYGHEFELDGILTGVDWISHENGASLTLGFLFCHSGTLNGAKSLTMYSVDQSQSARPTVSSRIELLLPNASLGLAMAGSTVLTWGLQFIFLHNLDTKRSVHLLLPETQPTSRIHYAVIHPCLPLRVFMLSATSQTRKFAEVDNPWDLPRLEGAGGKGEWKACRLISRSLQHVDMPAPVMQPHRRNPRRFALHIDRDNLAIIDIYQASPTALSSIQHPAESTARNPPIPVKNYRTFWACSMPRGKLFVFQLKEKRVDLFQYSKGSLNLLGCLDPIATGFIANSLSVKVSFSPVDGTLLLQAEGRVLVLKY
ncbi:hypothetical protein C8R43DRAFT_964903 [Mycena crocata]|nr:hypothetical protein C8R43DRAFT_964903 [Mycena crocata]